ncbi:MAG: DUF1328 domain-containing protein [Verrucomicrobia bacterium]|nr:DUF1328 domain-containing protein [Verrucomicrobiota bacterium]
MGTPFFSVAGVLGFGEIAGAGSGIAQILFFVFLVLLVVSAKARELKVRALYVTDTADHDSTNHMIPCQKTIH